jgi:hypothetical protein
MAKNFSVFYGAWSFVTMFTKDCHCTVSSASLLRPTSSMLCIFSIHLVLQSSNFESLFILQDSPARMIGLLQIFYMSRTKQRRKTHTPFPERNSDPHRLFELFKTVLVCVFKSLKARPHYSCYSLYTLRVNIRNLTRRSLASTSTSTSNVDAPLGTYEYDFGILRNLPWPHGNYDHFKNTF